MGDKFDIERDLGKMLEEIQEDEQLDEGRKNVKLSQDDIKKMIAARKKEKGESS